MSAGEKPARATSFLRLVFESLDIYLHWANEAKQGEFINNVLNYPKIVGALFKGKWYELSHFVTQLLEFRRASHM